MRRYGLIGYPLTHSFSEEYFNRRFEREGITGCVYELFPLSSIVEFPGLLSAHPDLEGVNVTIPYKKAVIAYLDDASHLPMGLDACNCIRIRNNKLTGFNTDIAGFEKSLRPLLQPHHQKALVLGNGGATSAVAYVLNKLGLPFQIVSRSLKEGSTLTYDMLDGNIIVRSQVIINTTPLGMFPETGACPDIPYQYITQGHLLFDLVYNPSKTLFLQKGEERGAMIRNGQEMLEIQAEESWRIWNS